MSATGYTSPLRWGSGTRANFTAARARLLDAALICYQRLGICRTSVSDIAQQAHVTRPTVYRYFDGHQDILKSVVRRELERFWNSLRSSFAEENLTIGDYLIEVLTRTLNHARTQQTGDFLFLPGVLPILQELLLTDQEHLHALFALLHPIYQRLTESAATEDFDLLVLCEWFNRMLASYLERPSSLGYSEEELRRLFRHLLPALA